MQVFVFANIVIKIILLCAVAYMFAFPDQPQFEGKSLMLRAVLYPIFAFLIFVMYRLKKMKGPYPHAFDFFWTFTFTIDIVGNDIGYYNTFPKFDDIVHVINGVPYMFLFYAFLLSLERLGVFRLGFWGINIFSFAIFLSCHTLWEMWEYGMDRFFGTFLQPGGMTEATENNLSGIFGSFLGIMFLYFLRRNRFVEQQLFTPTYNYIKQLLSHS